jgi:polar amino acid transport system ATP-binding protein
MNATDNHADVSPKGAASVRMRGVDKSFGSLTVLQELNLDVEPGERVVIIGPSGSGKTTILRVTMTLERIDSGTIQIGGSTSTTNRPAPGSSRKPARSTSAACARTSGWCSSTSTCSRT